MNSAFLCQWKGHRRSGRSAQFDFDKQQWTSVCKRCGIPLARIDGEWRADEEALKPESEAA